MVETRWFYIYDIFQFILDNKNDILVILKEEELEVSMDELIQLYKLILPLRHFVDRMESNLSICCIGKYIHELLDYLRKEDFSLMNGIFKD